MSKKRKGLIQKELQDNYGIQLSEEAIVPENESDKWFHVNIKETNIEPEIEAFKSLVQGVYNINTLSNSWTVTMNGLAVLPEQLVQKADGGYLINLKTLSNHFGKTVDLKPLGNGVPVATNVAALIWALGSYIFQKHYLNNIDKKLASVQKTVEEIKSFLEADKQAEIKSALDIVNYISNNYQDITINQRELDMRLGQLADIEIIAGKNVEFYGNRLNTKIDNYTSKHKRKNEEALKGDLKYDWMSYNSSIRLLIITKLLIELLSKDMNIEVLNNLELMLSDVVDRYSEQYDILYDHLYEYNNKKLLVKANRGLSWTLDKIQNTIPGKAAQFVFATPFSFLVNDEIDNALEKGAIYFENKANDSVSSSVTGIMELDEDELLEPFQEMISEMKGFYEKPVQITCDGDELYIAVA